MSPYVTVVVLLLSLLFLIMSAVPLLIGNSGTDKTQHATGAKINRRRYQGLNKNPHHNSLKL